MLNRILNQNNIVFRCTSKVLDTVLLNLLWMVLCIPIFTAGPATTALYYTAVKCLRRGEDQPYLNFVRCFRENFKVGSLTTLIAIAIGLFLGCGAVLLHQLSEAGDQLSAVMYVTYQIFMMLVIGIGCYLFPLLSRFSLRIGELWGAAVKLAIRHLPSTIVLALLNTEAVLFCLRYFCVPVLIVPVLSILLSSLFLERIFKKYTPADAGAMAPWYLK